MRGCKRECYYKRSKLSKELKMIEFNVELDASGLNCPLPLLRLKKALITMSSGDVVKVIATDPAAHLDFGVYANQTGHHIIHLAKEVDRQIFYVKKK
jgi:tRNA 2-thiouridine synthesizing protein A